MPENDDNGNPTRRRLLRAAQRLFADGGYDGVSVGELAGAAGVNRAMLYYYFKDKRDLYREAITNVLEVIPALWEREELRAGAPAERLDRYVAALWEALAEHRDAMPMVMRELASGGPERELIFSRYLVPNARFVAGIIADGINAGDFSPALPLFAAVAVVSGIIMPNFGFAVAGAFGAEVAGSVGEGREYADFYRAYVKRALAAGPPKRGDKRGKDK
jgi:TetR/AcrR family transcriptional regulator